MNKKDTTTPTIIKDPTISSFRKTQRIIGIVAAGGIILTSISMLFFPVDSNKSFLIWSILIILTIFTGVFYLTPSLYMKKGLTFLPDLIFNTGFFILMINLGDKGDLLITLLALFIVINALTKSTLVFILSAFEFIVAIVIYYLIIKFGQPISYDNVIFQLLGLITLIFILRVFAKETIFLRSKEKHLINTSQQFEGERDKILMLINNLSDGLISVDNNQKITAANTAALAMLTKNTNSNALINKLIDDIMPVILNDTKLSLTEETFNSKEQKTYKDLRLVTPVGAFRISATVTPIMGVDKHQLGAVILFRDITADKSLEDQRAEFNAVASHELRTPLAVMDGYIYTLLLDKNLKYDAKTREYLEQIDKAVKSLISLTNDILTVTESDNNQIKSMFEKTDIKKIIKDVAKNLKEKAVAKNLKLILNIDENLPIVLTDAGKFTEVLINIAENAVKFTEKGSITINASENKKGIVLIEVIDTGEGIKEIDQKRIFNRFFRVNDYKTQKVGGTGLGLFIARTFITAMGGKIGVKSEIGKGSTFWFSIPVSVKKIVKLKKSEKQLDDFVQNL